jgi:hypothetical protein
MSNLTEANLCGAILEGASLDKAYLHWARYDDDTIWPAHFDPVGAGAIRES